MRSNRSLWGGSGAPEEVAATLAFLASADSSNITGAHRPWQSKFGSDDKVIGRFDHT
jgi:NAD(P)-dependent dehydrogenase (short-subunit alcohol dehydrogenase family)